MTGSRRYKAFTEGGWSAAVTESDYQPIPDNYFKAQCMDAFFFFVLTTSIAAVLVTRGCVEIRMWSFPRERGKDQGRTQYKWMPVTVPLLCCAVVGFPSRMDNIIILIS